MCPQELDYLQQVWELTQAWELRWGEWKTGSFRTLQTETMESIARGLLRQLHKLSRDLKVGAENPDVQAPTQGKNPLSFWH